MGGDRGSFAARTVPAVDLRPVVTHHFSVFRPSNNGCGCPYVGQAATRAWLTAGGHYARCCPLSVSQRHPLPNASRVDFGRLWQKAADFRGVRRRGSRRRQRLRWRYSALASLWSHHRAVLGPKDRRQPATDRRVRRRCTARSEIVARGRIPFADTPPSCPLAGCRRRAQTTCRLTHRLRCRREVEVARTRRKGVRIQQHPLPNWRRLDRQTTPVSSTRLRRLLKVGQPFRRARGQVL